jgi:hypothetical protein
MTPRERLELNIKTLRESIELNSKDFARGFISKDALLAANKWCLEELDKLKREIESGVRVDPREQCSEVASVVPEQEANC